MDKFPFLKRILLLIVMFGMSFNLLAAPKPADNNRLAKLPPELLALMTPEMIFNYFAAAFNGQRVTAADNSTRIHITDLDVNYRVEIKHKIMHLYANKNAKADVDVNMNQSTAQNLILGQLTPKAAIKDGSVKISGDPDKVRQMKIWLHA